MPITWIIAVYVASSLVSACQSSHVSTPSTAAVATSANTAPTTDGNGQQALVRVKRIYIDTFGDDSQSRQIQAMVAAALAENKRFIVTENKARADAVLKGSGEEKSSQEFHSYKEGTAAGGFGGSSSSTPGYASSGIAGRAAAINDAGASTETIDRVSVAVRLVDRDGDVIWSTKQDSHGAKYKGATADVADKIVKQLTWAAERAEKGSSPPGKQ